MRVLIAEDDPISRKVLEKTLAKWGYEVVVTCDGQEALDALKADGAPRLAVLDWMMPKKDGPEVCRNIRQIPGGEYFYILLLTAKGTKDNIVEGLDAGADDYVIKPFDSRELRVRVSCGQRIVDLQSELVAARDKLHVQATHDGLTGLLNRSAIFDTLTNEQTRAIRDSTSLSVVMIDLDHFKSVNDNFGHSVGDIILTEAARRMVDSTRKYDFVGRYGGEEFILVLPNCGSDACMRRAERICQSISAEQFDIGNSQTIPVSASFGVVSTDTFPRADVDELVKIADNALYQAKERGRNQVVLATIDNSCEALK